MKHYWVQTPEITRYYDYEPPEISCIVECIEADNQAKAKGKFVAGERKKKNQDSWLSHCDYLNPFIGLKVRDAMCEHGVCNCDLNKGDNCELGKPRHPKADYCGECCMESEAEEIKQALVDFANGDSSAEFRYRTAVEELMRLLPETASEAASDQSYG